MIVLHVVEVSRRRRRLPTRKLLDKIKHFATDSEDEARDDRFVDIVLTELEDDERAGMRESG